VVPEPQIYVPIQQNPWVSATLIVRAAGGSAAALAPAVRAALARIDKTRALTRVRTLAEIERAATARWRFRAQLVAAFATLALAVALVGVFGVLAFSGQQQRGEFGVRLARGARRADIMNLVLSNAARVVGIGAIVGLAAAAVLTRSIATLLFAVTPLDPLTFAVATVLLFMTAAAATAAPAWRASRVDPVVTFRND
jgi:ABC-type antimicrobial peptide transport system permease subunit